MKGGWYIGPMETALESVLGPLPYIVQGKDVLLATISVPIMIDGHFRGVAGSDFNLDFMQTLTKEASKRVFGGRGSVTILSDLGLTVASSGHPEMMGKLDGPLSPDWQADLQTVKGGKATVGLDTRGDTMRAFVPIELGQTERPWSVLVEVPRGVALAEAALLGQQLASRGKTEARWQIGAGLLVVLTGVGAVALLVGRLVRPVATMTRAMLRLAGRDMTTEIPGVARGDEIGAMACAVKVFKDNMIEADRQAAEREAARGLRERRQAAMERHTGDFGASISGVMASLAGSADAMRHASEGMTDDANAVSVEARKTVTGAAKSSRNLVDVAAAVEELTSIVAEISRQVVASGAIARQAVERTEASHGTMENLSAATARIGDVVSLISQIASQTNLLALNATIEAARGVRPARASRSSPVGGEGRSHRRPPGRLPRSADQTKGPRRDRGGGGCDA